jgi:hypothetical protein
MQRVYYDPCITVTDDPGFTDLISMAGPGWSAYLISFSPSCCVDCLQV